MAPRGLLTTRQLQCNQFNECCSNGFNSNGTCNSTWGNWGRWVFLAAIIIFFLIVAVGFACLNSRRRRRAGLSPRYGTGWAAGKTPFGHNGPQYNQGGAAPPYQAPPPVYGQNTGNTFNSNDGYYGQGQQSGIELQQPQNVYQQPPYHEPYAAPTGPPPAKN